MFKLETSPTAYPPRRDPAWDALVSASAQDPEYQEWDERLVRARRKYRPRMARLWPVMRPRVAATIKLMGGCQRTLERFPAKVAPSPSCWRCRPACPSFISWSRGPS